MELHKGSAPRLFRILRPVLAVTVIALGAVMISSTPASAVTRSAIVSVAQGQLGNAARNHESPDGQRLQLLHRLLPQLEALRRVPLPATASSGATATGAPTSPSTSGRTPASRYADVPETSGGVLTGWAASFKDYGVQVRHLAHPCQRLQPQPGDAVVFDWDQSGDIDHVGIVTSANSSTVYTIEGNSGDRIKANSYSRSNVDIVGYSAPVGADELRARPRCTGCCRRAAHLHRDRRGHGQRTHGAVASTATLGFTPKAMATLNFNTLLVTEDEPEGKLYRVDVITNNNSLIFNPPILLGNGHTHDLLAFDGNPACSASPTASSATTPSTPPNPPSPTSPAPTQNRRLHPQNPHHHRIQLDPGHHRSRPAHLLPHQRRPPTPATNSATPPGRSSTTSVTRRQRLLRPHTTTAPSPLHRRQPPRRQRQRPHRPSRRRHQRLDPSPPVRPAQHRPLTTRRNPPTGRAVAENPVKDSPMFRPPPPVPALTAAAVVTAFGLSATAHPAMAASEPAPARRGIGRQRRLPARRLRPGRHHLGRRAAGHPAQRHPHGKMRGHMSAYRVSCARDGDQGGEGPRAGPPSRGDRHGHDHRGDQHPEHQRGGRPRQPGPVPAARLVGQPAQRLNPTWATNAFLDKMIRLYPNNSRRTAPIGEVRQAVQVSAYPDRYQPQAGDAQSSSTPSCRTSAGRRERRRCTGCCRTDGSPTPRSTGPPDAHPRRGRLHRHPRVHPQSHGHAELQHAAGHRRRARRQALPRRRHHQQQQPRSSTRPSYWAPATPTTSWPTTAPRLFGIADGILRHYTINAAKPAITNISAPAPRRRRLHPQNPHHHRSQLDPGHHPSRHAHLLPHQRRHLHPPPAPRHHLAGLHHLLSPAQASTTATTTTAHHRYIDPTPTTATTTTSPAKPPSTPAAGPRPSSPPSPTPSAEHDAPVKGPGSSGVLPSVPKDPPNFLHSLQPEIAYAMPARIRFGIGRASLGGTGWSCGSWVRLRCGAAGDRSRSGEASRERCSPPCCWTRAGWSPSSD